MKYIIDFYKNLDAVNLIVFWGTLIVVILLLTFSIILANKNKKLKYIIESRGIDIDNYENDEELAIKKDISKEDEVVEKKIIEEKIEKKQIEETKETNIKEEPVITKENQNETFTPEELVMEYNKTDCSNNINYNNQIRKEEIDLPNKNVYNNYVEQERKIEKVERKIIIPNNETVQRRTPDAITSYQNVNEFQRQTSPIGLIKKENAESRELSKANELHNNLHYDDINKQKIVISNINSVNRQKEIAEEIKKQPIHEEKPKGNYLEEISKSLSKITNDDQINRTEYELKQEEEAIISYKELMEKKDSIKTIDEEEAVISIEELVNKKKQQDKLYNITNEAENDNFIDELKSFRSDL